VVGRPDAVTPDLEGRPDGRPIRDVLEADEFPTDAVGGRLIDEDAAGDGGAGSVGGRFGFGTFVFGGCVRRHGLSL
jgi:hypothetical protein